MQRELEAGDDAEVAATALERPEQVRVLAGIGMDEPAIGGDDIGRDEVVDAQAVATPEPADPATQGQAADAGVRDEAARRREPERLRRRIDVAPGRAALHPRATTFGVHPHAAHPGQVDHHAALPHGVTGDVVAAAADRDRQAVVAGERHGRHDIGLTARPDDHRRPPVDHRVPDRAGRVVPGIGRDQDIALDEGAQLSERRSVHRVSLVWRQGRHRRSLRRRVACCQRQIAMERGESDTER